MPGLTASAIEANAVIVGACLVAIAVGTGLAPLCAMAIGAARRRRAATRPVPGIGDDIRRDGTPYDEDEIERMIRNYPEGENRA